MKMKYNLSQIDDINWKYEKLNKEIRDLKVEYIGDFAIGIVALTCGFLSVPNVGTIDQIFASIFSILAGLIFMIVSYDIYTKRIKINCKKSIMKDKYEWLRDLK